MEDWLLLGGLEPLFLAAVFLGSQRRAIANPWLIAWLSIALAHQLGIYMAFAHPGVLPGPLAIGLGLLPLAHGPVAFAYVSALVPPSFLTRTAPLHLVPYVALWSALTVIDATGVPGFQVSTDFGFASLENASGHPLAGYGLLMAVSGGTYPLLGLWLVRRSRPDRMETRSDPAQVDYRWLQVWLLLHLASFIAIAIQQTTMPLDQAMLMASLTMAVEVLFVGYFGLRQIQSPARSAPLPHAAQPATLADDAQRLADFMHANEAFLEPQLSLTRLSELSGLSATTLSASIKHLGYKHFFDYVNRLRCERFRTRLQQEPDARILDLALECGFNSKSAFNRVYSKLYGTPPSALRAQTKTP